MHACHRVACKLLFHETELYFVCFFAHTCMYACLLAVQSTLCLCIPGHSVLAQAVTDMKGSVQQEWLLTYARWLFRESGLWQSCPDDPATVYPARHPDRGAYMIKFRRCGQVAGEHLVLHLRSMKKH